MSKSHLKSTEEAGHLKANTKKFMTIGAPLAVLLLLIYASTNVGGLTSSTRHQELLRGVLFPLCANSSMPEPWRQKYLDLVRESLTGALIRTPSIQPYKHNSSSELDIGQFNAKMREIGTDWPLYGYSMVGTMRLKNIQQVLEACLAEGVPGNFVECGVWRGGSSIFAQAVLHAHGATSQREVHLVDSFNGLPANTTAQDEDYWSRMEFLKVSLQEVQDNFRRYSLLLPNVKFHRGYFRYALPAWRAADNSSIAVLRMDGDMYESTMDQLYNLWDAVPAGGFVIVDDYYAVKESKVAIHEFLSRNGIEVQMEDIDGSAVYFRKPASKGGIDHGWYAAWNASRSLDDASVG